MLESRDLKIVSPTFGHAYPVIISYPEFVYHAENQFITLIPFLDIVSLKFL